MIPSNLVGSFLSFGVFCFLIGVGASVVAFFLARWAMDGIGRICLRVSLWIAEKELRARRKKFASLKSACAGEWEAVQDPRGGMWRVRCSLELPEGFLYVRRFSGSLAEQFARSEARRFNAEGRRP